MVELCVCVGSSCHLKGAYQVIKAFQQLIDAYDVSGAVDLKASFCLGECSSGVTVKVNGQLYTGVSPETANAFFVKKILTLAEADKTDGRAPE